MRYFFLLLVFCSQTIISAQSINYQAILRDASGKPISNNTIDIQFAIIDQNNSQIYSEVHNNINTSELGLIQLAIGEGNGAGTAITDINWSNSSYSLAVELDLEQNGTFVKIGEEPIRTVPLAINALNVIDYSAGDGLNISNGVITNTGDTNPNDDLTTNTMMDGDVQGRYDNIKIKNRVINSQHLQSMGATDGQVLTYRNNQWRPEKTTGGDEIIAGNKIRISKVPSQTTVHARVPSMAFASIDQHGDIRFSNINNDESFSCRKITGNGPPYYLISWGALNPTNSCVIANAQFTDARSSVNYDINNTIKVYMVDPLANPIETSFFIQIVKN